MKTILLQHSWILVLVVLWSIPWKGVALWKSAKRDHLGWFIVLLIINTLAILDILYIFIFSKMGMKKDEPAAETPSQDNPNPPVRNNIV
jgi:hypothetical protein